MTSRREQDGPRAHRHRTAAATATVSASVSAPAAAAATVVSGLFAMLPGIPPTFLRPFGTCALTKASTVCSVVCDSEVSLVWSVTSAYLCVRESGHGHECVAPESD